MNDTKLQPEESRQKDDGEQNGFAKAAPPKRTLGLKLFDIGLYPILTNFGVFALSVVFTFLTQRGGDLAKIQGKDGLSELKPVYGKVGQWFAKRGVWLEDKFTKYFGMNKSQAEMGRIVFFSFADGTLLAPLVKVIEDRREKIAHWIDDKLGTKSADLRAYEAEPKQSWGSVILGRLATALIVVPTAMVLDKKIFYQNRNKVPGAFGSDPDALVFRSKVHSPNTSLNDVLFNNTSVRHGESLMAKPSVRDKFYRFIKKLTGISGESTILERNNASGHVEIHSSTKTSITDKLTGQSTQTKTSQEVGKYSEVRHGDIAAKTLAKMTYFEAFYTSVCTAGLYVSSRFIARLFGKKEEKNKAKATVQLHLEKQPSPEPVNDGHYHQDIRPKKAEPACKINAVELQDRLSPLPSPHAAMAGG